jgi:hypothetical protein
MSISLLPMRRRGAWALLPAVLLAFAALFAARPGEATWIWVEGEKPSSSTMQPHVWYDQVQRDQLSGGALISNFGSAPGEALYRVTLPADGEYEFWVRANPVSSRLSYQFDGSRWTPIDMTKDARDTVNIALDQKIDLRFLAWVKVGKATLKKGDHRIRFRMDSENSNHGYIDCFVLSSAPFRPVGTLKPDQINEATRRAIESDKGWFAFDPEPDTVSATSGFDLRSLNEKEAGEGGFIGVKGSQFIHTKTGEPVRFWAVNGPSSKDRASLRSEARMLAKHGVNLVRIHGGYFDEKGEVDMAKVRHAIDVVETMKAEGIYSHFSIYFPLWLTPRPDNPWLRGYDGKTHPFAALYFNKDFQKKYREWWQALLLTPSESTGRRLIEEPAIAGAEIINEDSYFFWTFGDNGIPDPQMRILETQFGDWLKQRYGSIDKALAAWGGGPKVPRDRPSEGRVGFRPLWNIFNEKTKRDKDTVHFLLESQRGFYSDTIRFLRGLGFQGTITASNWATASPEVLGPLEKYSYTVGDFIDRHGYFGCAHEGEEKEWSIRDGHRFGNRSALRFESGHEGKPRVYLHPAMDPSYDGKPSMISETTWNRPNRYRSEAPLFYAVYGALQDSDAIVHFALDGANWSVKPGFFMQPWTLMSPAMMGQFPAAALIYRKGLIAPGAMLVDLNLGLPNLLDLQGTPMPQDAAFDELRLKDVPAGTTIGKGQVIDPLVHFAGRTNVNFSERAGPAKLADLSKLIDHAHETVTSSTGQLRLDYGKGVLTINAPAAQGVSGMLREAGTTELADLAIASGLELGHIVAVSFDGQPLATSRKILLQAMSEEKPAGLRTEPAGAGLFRILSIGHDPWMVKQIEGIVRLKRPDAARLKVVALDPNGKPGQSVGPANEFRLLPSTLYYLITPLTNP